MKFYYFNEPVKVIEEVKSFNIAKIKFQNGRVIYVDSKLITNEIKLNKNLVIRI